MSILLFKTDHDDESSRSAAAEWQWQNLCNLNDTKRLLSPVINIHRNFDLPVPGREL